MRTSQGVTHPSINECNMSIFLRVYTLKNGQKTKEHHTQEVNLGKLLTIHD